MGRAWSVASAGFLFWSLGPVEEAQAGRPRYPEAVVVQAAERPVAGTDRPGGDFLSLDLPAPEPAICESLCRRHKRCRSYAFVSPGVQGPFARCWLKDQVVPPVADACCTSGTVAAPRPFDPNAMPAVPAGAVPPDLPAAAPRATAPRPLAVPALVVVGRTPASGGRLPLVRDVAFYDQLVFGPQEPNVASYFESTSNGRFFFVRAGAVGVFDLPTPTGQEEHADAIDAVVRSGFSFWEYDFNQDGRVDETELVVIVLSNHTRSGGAARRICRNVGSRGPFDNVELCAVGSNVAAAGQFTETYNLSHEVMHLLGPTDLYGPWAAGECWNGGYTLMGCARGGSSNQQIWTHLDPWHKIRLGWVRPRYLPVGAPASQQELRAPMGSDEQPLVLYDPARPREFYILEYRHPRTTDPWDVYDRHSACPGVVTWYLQVGDNGWPDELKILRPGNDRAFQTVRAPGDSWRLDTGGGRFLDPGEERTFQSQLVLEEWKDGRLIKVGDRLDAQKLLFVGQTPSVVGARGAGTSHRALTRKDAPVVLRWLDGGAAAQLSVLGSDTRAGTVWIGPVGQTAPRPVLAGPGGDTETVGVDQIGCDFDGGRRAADAAACKQLCRGAPDCGAYTFVRGSGMCFLKFGSGGSLPNAGCVSGALGDR